MSFNSRLGGITAVLAAALVLLTPSLSLPAAWSLLAGDRYGAGSDFADLTVADFTNDNIPDIIGVNHHNNGSISFFEGNPDGRFENRRVHKLAHDPIAIESADFDADGNIDIVMANWDDNTVSIMMGRGDSAFDDPLPSLITDDEPVDIEVADLDGVNGPDILVACLNGGTVNVFLNDGTGAFPTRDAYLAGAQARSLTAADFDGDGDIDVACSNWDDNTVSFLWGSPGGVLSDKDAADDVQTGNKPWTVESADFNLDGIPDIAVSNTADDMVYAFLGLGGGAFGSFDSTPATAYKLPTAAGPAGVTAALMNNDRYPDLLIADALGNNLTIYMGRGDGRFDYYSDFYTTIYPVSVRSGDFNGDLLNDSAVAVFSSGLASVNLADLTLEGRWAFGQYTSTPAPSYPAGLSPAHLLTGSLDGDTMPDIVATDAGGASNILPGAGDGSLGAFAAYPAAVHTPACSPVDVDLNGDIRRDRATAIFDTITTAGSVEVQLVFGSFTTTTSYPVGIGPTCIHPVDLNSDGFPDLVTSNSVGVVPDGGTDPVYTVSVLLNNTDGTFQPSVNYGLAGEPVNVTSGDLNGDGFPDLVIPNLVAGNPDIVTVLVNNRGSGFSSIVDYIVGESPGSVLIFDLNRDDMMDMAVPNTDDNNVMVLLSNDTEFLQPQAPLMVGAAPVFVAACDLDMNGLVDLAVGNSGDNTVSVILSEEKSTLTVDVNDPAMGSVDIKIGTDPATDGEHDTGTIFTLTPMPVSGHTFTGWSGDIKTKDNPLTLRLGGDKTLTANFAVGPYITGVAPDNGIMGDSVTVTGNTFGSAGTVKLGGKSVKNAVWSDTAITFSVPAKIPFGEKVLQITSKDTNTYGTVPFTVNQAQIDSLSAGSGAPGSSLTINGTDFGTGKFKAYFYTMDGITKKGARVTSSTSGPDTVTVTVPRLAPGDYNVVIRNSHGYSKVVNAADNDFTVTAP